MTSMHLIIKNIIMFIERKKLNFYEEKKNENFKQKK